MVGAADMPGMIIDSLTRHASGTTVFDMVTTPARTPFLAAGEAAGARAVDGLTMLIGQARQAFELFFDHQAPRGDQELRDLLDA
jgi:shikimate dehydrogenase